MKSLAVGWKQKSPMISGRAEESSEHYCVLTLSRILKALSFEKLKLPFAVLVTCAGTTLTVFFSLFHTIVASEKTCLFEDGTKFIVKRNKSTRDPMPHGTGLTGFAPTADRC